MTYADISKAAEALQYRPEVSLKKGISDYVDWYVSKDDRGGG